jgi:glutamine amidotransferase-like uncharacterized protein
VDDDERLGSWRPDRFRPVGPVIVGLALTVLGGATRWPFDHRPVTETAGAGRSFPSAGMRARPDLAGSFVAPASPRARPVRIALFRDASSGDCLDDLERILGSESSWTWHFVGPEEIRVGGLGRSDVVIFPGGQASLQLESLGDAGKEAVRRFVGSGGGYVGICAGGFLATARYLELAEVEVLTGDRYVPGVGVRSMMARGPGIVETGLTEAGRRVFGGMAPVVAVDFAGGPIFLKNSGAGAPAVITLAIYRTEVWDHDLQKGTMIGAPSIVAAQFGRGRVLAFSPHPERTPGLEPMVKQAIRAVARRTPEDDSDPVRPAAESVEISH